MNVASQSTTADSRNPQFAFLVHSTEDLILAMHAGCVERSAIFRSFPDTSVRGDTSTGETSSGKDLPAGMGARTLTHADSGEPGRKRQAHKTCVSAPPQAQTYHVHRIDLPTSYAYV